MAGRQEEVVKEAATKPVDDEDDEEEVTFQPARSSPPITSTKDAPTKSSPSPSPPPTNSASSSATGSDASQNPLHQVPDNEKTKLDVATKPIAGDGINSASEAPSSSNLNNKNVSASDGHDQASQQRTVTSSPVPIPSSSTSASTSSESSTSDVTTSTHASDSTSPNVSDAASPASSRPKRTRESERVQRFKRALDEGDEEVIRALAFQGIPDSTGLRSLYWKIMLNYLPADKSKWDEATTRGRQLYREWQDELILDPARFGHKPATEDHPLSLEDTSEWNKYFKDGDLEAELDKDVRRTFPHMHFFNIDKLPLEVEDRNRVTGHTRNLSRGAPASSSSSSASPAEEGNASDQKLAPQSSNDDPSSGKVTRHYLAVKRILFIYAKLNPGIGYVQGMNEILGPLYYIMAMDSDEEWIAHAEADAFFCFTNLMSEIRDNFCKTLDRSESGIRGSMKRLNDLLKEKHPELWQSLEDKQMDPQFYSFRWITLLLSQEFELPDVLRIWDSLFGDPHRFEFLMYFCCAMIISVTEELLAGSFADNLKLLQHFPSHIDIGIILQRAVEMRDEDKRLSGLPPKQLSSSPSTTNGNGSSAAKPAPNSPTVVPSVTEVVRGTLGSMFAGLSRVGTIGSRQAKPTTPGSASPPVASRQDKTNGT